MMGALKAPRRTEPVRDENSRKTAAFQGSGAKLWLKLAGGAETARAENFVGSQKRLSAPLTLQVRHARAWFDLG
jgi:hypothetical protein